MPHQKHSGKPWSACPDCAEDLSEFIKTRPPFESEKCPFCGAPIQIIWWQRVVWLSVAYFLTFAFPAWLGLRGWDVFFAGLICLVPAMGITYISVFKTMPRKYRRRNLMFLAMVTFLWFGASLNLFLAGATGRLYEFWSGRRGSARLFATISSPAVRLALSFLGFAFLLSAMYFGRLALAVGRLW